jgi:hypothetical protein
VDLNNAMSTGTPPRHLDADADHAARPQRDRCRACLFGAHLVPGTIPEPTPWLHDAAASARRSPDQSMSLMIPVQCTVSRVSSTTGDAVGSTPIASYRLWGSVHSSPNGRCSPRHCRCLRGPSAGFLPRKIWYKRLRRRHGISLRPSRRRYLSSCWPPGSDNMPAIYTSKHNQ